VYDKTYKKNKETLSLLDVSALQTDTRHWMLMVTLILSSERVGRGSDNDQEHAEERNHHIRVVPRKRVSALLRRG